MSKIIATDSFKTKNWDVQFDSLKSNSAELVIGFTDEGPIVEFKNLQFLYRLSHNGTVIQTKSYPPAGVRYVQSDQEYLVTERLTLEAEETYELYLWAENNGESFERTVTFTTPRPDQPFDSWTWDAAEKKWNSPVPYPSDNKYPYLWDEETTSWVKAPPPDVELSRVEFMLRLNDMGFLDDVEAAIESGQLSKRAEIMWKNSATFKRLNADLLLWASDLGFTDEQLDELFEINYGMA